MTLIHESTIKNTNGLFEIGIILNNKRYTYFLNSLYKVEQFGMLHKQKQTHGKAIAFLNKNNRKENYYDCIQSS